MIGPSSVRMKLIVVLTVLIGLISLAVYVYFPTRLRDQALSAVGAKAESIAEMTAYSVAAALVFDDTAAAHEAFEGARRNRDLAYVAVHDASGALFAAYPATTRLTSEQLRRRGAHVGALYETSHAIQHNDREIGRLYMGLSLEGVHAEIARSRATMAVVCLLLFLFGVVAVTIISAYITRPLSRIVHVVEEIATGKLDRRADVRGRDEMGHLAQSLNAMVDQLESLQHDLEARVADRTQALRTSEERYRLLFERNLAGVYRTTIDGVVLDSNEACARIFGFDSREQFLDARATDLFFDPEVRDQLLARLRRERSVSNVELHLRRRDGSSVWVLESMTLLDGDREIEATVIDITARKEAEWLIEHQAYHDALTGLPNRALFTDRVNVAVARARRQQNLAAVLFLDLDRFKYVNDTFGHSAGDLLLQQVAERLRGCVRAEDTVARLGGDEFTVLLSDLRTTADAALVAKKLIEIMAAPFTVLEHELFVTPSIGIAFFPADGEDVDTLLRNADNAMYRAKERGPNQYQLYSEAVNKRATGRLSLETSLRRAVERRELVVFYQPQVNIDTGDMVGLEALVRWKHPTRGLLAPDQFIGVAEEAKLIAAIDQWVLIEACREAQSWEQFGFRPARLSVNLSATQLHERDLPRVIERALAETSFDASRLELEITESAAVRTDYETVAMLGELRRRGVRISIDDFGTGHSALHYLHRFPVDTIKIDRTFVSAVDANPRSGAIIGAIVAMARALDLNVIVEGIETAEQLAVVRALGCTEMQGYLFSAPVPGPELLALATRRREVPGPRLHPTL